MHPENERRQWQNPESILNSIGLKPGMTFVDLGCGNGFFALPAARLVGAKGKVYGLDADDELIAELQRRANEEGLENLTLTKGRGEDTVLFEKRADIVFMGNVLHDFDEPAKVLVNARRMLKPDGALADVDWKDEPSPVGPPMNIRFSADKAEQTMKAAGFVTERPENVGLYHYLIIARLSEQAGS
jgi:ubiquinone/menaquinone biosynthesis C-methylase UbiE